MVIPSPEEVMKYAQEQGLSEPGQPRVQKESAEHSARRKSKAKARR